MARVASENVERLALSVERIMLDVRPSLAKSAALSVTYVLNLHRFLGYSGVPSARHRGFRFGRLPPFTIH